METSQTMRGSKHSNRLWKTLKGSHEGIGKQVFRVIDANRATPQIGVNMGIRAVFFANRMGITCI